MADIDPAAAIGAVHLTISDLARSIEFYESRLGFQVHRRDDRTAWLGAGGRDLLILSQCETAPRVRATTGLYHFAILVPTRADLSRSLRRLVATGTVLQGAADHGVSEALYLADPDGNGIEIYRDRPRDEWRRDASGELEMATLPMDVDGWDLEAAGRLLREARPRLAYLIPDFQNPTGNLMPDAEREQLARVLRRSGTVPVVATHAA